jgi:hypothetical protein
MGSTIKLDPGEVRVILKVQWEVGYIVIGFNRTKAV